VDPPMRLLPVCRRFVWRLRRSAATLLVIVGYLAGTLGFPLPAKVAKDTSRPFPCQDHACGCQNAEQCWRHCCCFSNEEKLAWARGHCVQPPEYLASSSPHGWRTPRLHESVTQPESPCSCGQTACTRDHGDTANAQAAPSSKTQWVLGWAAQRCQGHGPLGLPTFVALRPPQPIAWTCSAEPSGYCSPPFTPWTSHTAAPAEPPPRVRA
jgi:hypothetical protein